MKVTKSITSRTSEAGDLFKFLWKSKMWFLIPFICLLIVFGLIVFFAQATGIAPFIYPLI